MLTIRKKQIQAFEPPLRQRLHQKLLRHVRTHFVEETEGRTDQELLEHIGAAHLGAESYGIRAERDLYLYVNITVIHGLDFDRAEETAWTKEVLSDQTVSDPGQRMDRLYEAVIHRLEVEEANARTRERFYGSDGGSPSRGRRP